MRVPALKMSLTANAIVMYVIDGRVIYFSMDGWGLKAPSMLDVISYGHYDAGRVLD